MPPEDSLASKSDDTEGFSFQELAVIRQEPGPGTGLANLTENRMRLNLTTENKRSLNLITENEFEHNRKQEFKPNKKQEEFETRRK